ncbi:MAG: hypothetical protein KAT35_01340, partial [Candidatus Aenigmarchaeota archaeon]|nr:hypothetical protein [Candidatus Aenigmarchaeota archaeon]
MDWRYLIVFILILVLFPGVSASDAPNVTLTSPGNGSVQITSNFTLACNVTDDENVFNVSLFTSISGSFMQYDTDRVMEIDSDSDTLLMCHFNGTYVCDDGEAGTNTSTDFVQGRFMQGVRINNSDTLIYPTSSNIVYNK